MPTAPETAIGLDVGGTRIRAARITRDGQMQGRIIEPACADREGFTAQILRLISACKDEGTRAVGIGVPGRVAGSIGEVSSAGYLDIAGLDLSGLIRAKASLPCRVENDATMALIAEARGILGLVAMITVGTGVGGALVVDGAPLYGSDFAGQFGHIVVAPDGPLCNCGRRGCVETLCAGPALGALIAEAGLPPTTTASDVLSARDAATALIATTWAEPMARAMQSLIAVIDPARIILGGGLGNDMARALARLPVQGAWFDRPVAAAKLGDDAGVIGAGLAGFMVADPR